MENGRKAIYHKEFQESYDFREHGIPYQNGKAGRRNLQESFTPDGVKMGREAICRRGFQK
jgi:hypothetical protein